MLGMKNASLDKKLGDSKQHSGPGLSHTFFLVPSVLFYPDSKTLSKESSFLLFPMLKKKKKIHEFDVDC